MLASRIVLADCRRAVEKLEETISDDDFRLYYVAAIALIRAVGHVLHNIDAPRSPQLAQSINEAFKDWKSHKEAHPIFWEFIEAERNNVLKEYEIGYQQGSVNVVIPGVSGRQFALDENLFRPLTEGSFAGDDVRDILLSAISWWEAQLARVEGSSVQR
jgi:hypothetical protein